MRCLQAAIALTACFVAPLAAQTPDLTSLDQFASDELAKSKIPGATITIVRGDTVVYSKSIGSANIETGEVVRPEMLFRLGSTTKMFTAAALADLAVQGRIDLNAPVSTYLKFLPPKLSRITSNQLLSHTAGLRNDGTMMYGLHDDSALGDGIRTWTDDRLFTSPGEVFSYSNEGYWLAGYLIETLTSMRYADAMDTLIFKPLGMTHTTLRPTMAMTWPLVQGHEYKDGRFEIVRPAADNSAEWPAGSIFSNIQDLARFAVTFMNQGRLDGKQVLDPKVIELISSPRVKIPGGSNTWVNYCYGLQSGGFRGADVAEHRGSRLGYGSHIRIIPSQHVAIIVLTNRTDGWLPATTVRAMELLISLRPDSPAETKRVLRLTMEDLKRIVGVYQNGSERIEILARENRLFLKLEPDLVKRGFDPEAELKKHSKSSFTTSRMEVTVVAGTSGTVEYVYIGEFGQSFARVH